MTRTSPELATMPMICSLRVSALSTLSPSTGSTLPASSHSRSRSVINAIKDHQTGANAAERLSAVNWLFFGRLLGTRCAFGVAEEAQKSDPPPHNPPGTRGLSGKNIRGALPGTEEHRVRDRAAPEMIQAVRHEE